MNTFSIQLLILLLPGLAGPSNSKPLIYTSFDPLTCFAERIGGDLIEVVCPVPSGDDPTSWKPSRETIQAMQRADLVLVNGARFERWVEQVSLPRATLVDVSRPFRGQFLQLPSVRAHSHGPEGARAHEGVDGHTWLDPRLAARQAEQIRKALALLLPEEAARIDDNCRSLLSDLDGLDGAHRRLAERLGETPLLASHPAYQYVARRYGWKLRSLDLHPDAVPDAEGRAALRSVLAEHPARIILFESEPALELAELLRSEFGLRCVLFSPAESPPPGPREPGQDYFSVMTANLERLAEALERLDR